MSWLLLPITIPFSGSWNFCSLEACWLWAGYLFTRCFPSSENSGPGISALCPSIPGSLGSQALLPCMVSPSRLIFLICFFMLMSVYSKSGLVFLEFFYQKFVYFFPFFFLSLLNYLCLSYSPIVTTIAGHLSTQFKNFPVCLLETSCSRSFYSQEVSSSAWYLLVSEVSS